MGNEQNTPEKQTQLNRNSAELALELEGIGVHAKNQTVEDLK